MVVIESMRKSGSRARMVLVRMALASVLASTACARGPVERHYEVRGQIVDIESSRHEVTLKHDAIPDYMSAMTMPFKVETVRLLQGRVPGDLVTATLVVRQDDAFLRTMK